MNYIQCPPHPQAHNGPHFDRHQFADQRRFLNGSGLAFQDAKRMHLMRVADLTKGRRLETPAWAMSDKQMREVLISYLESRFYVKNRQGTLQDRLARCKAAGKKSAAKAKRQTEHWVQGYRSLNAHKLHELPQPIYSWVFFAALRGEPLSAPLQSTELQINNLDSQAMVSERAAEIVLAVAFYAYRLGWNSPSIGEQLGLKPPAVRQILHRLNRSANRLQGILPLRTGNINKHRRLEEKGPVCTGPSGCRR